MSLEVWLLFTLTETVLCLSPGPAVLLVLSVGFCRKLLLLSLGKQLEQRGMRAQTVILRGPFSGPPIPVARSSAPSRCSCESHRSARRPLGSENTPRPSGAASPCGCLAPPGCCQTARQNRA